MRLASIAIVIVTIVAFTQPAFSQLNPMWYGTWNSQDGKTTLTISASKIDISVVRINEKGKPERGQSGHRWATKSQPDSDIASFGYSNKLTSPGEIAKRYQEVFTIHKKDPQGYRISDPAISRAAIGAISPGVYKVMWVHDGGPHCHAEYIVDKDKMLEIEDCRYFSVQLFTRVR